MKICARQSSFYEIITRFENQLPSRCKYCSIPHCESIQGRASNIIWKLFRSPLVGIHLQGSVRQVLQNWWTVKQKNMIHKLLLHIVPIVINQEIWKSSSACKYDDQKIFYPFPRCNSNIPWSRACDTIERMRPISNWKLVL